MAMKLSDYPVVKNTGQINEMIENLVEKMYKQENSRSDNFKEVKFNFEFERPATISADKFPQMMKQKPDYVKYYNDTFQMDNIIRIA